METGTGESGAVSYGAQVGPSFVVTDGGESDTVLSGKVYGSVAATESLSLYGELSFAGGVDDADNGYGTKIRCNLLVLRVKFTI